MSKERSRRTALHCMLPVIHWYLTLRFFLDILFNTNKRLNNKMDCFTSSDRAALNATLLYDFNEDKGDIWRRSSQDVPLPLCSSSSTSPPDSRCLVCVDQIVHAVCRDLTDGVKLIMEAGGHQVKISKSECPKPPSVDAYILPILLPILILLILMVVFFIYWKCCRNPKELRGDEIKTDKEEESSILTETPVKETEIP